MRWKAFFFTDNQQNGMNKKFKSYGIKTPHCPQQIKDMCAFESDLFKLIKSIQFKIVQCSFQNKLKNDISSIRNSTYMYTYADKTSNLYKLSKDDYNKLLINATTSNYKKTDPIVKDSINKEGKTILKKHDVYNKININGSSSCFITLKDHKSNFVNSSTVRLINPAKNEVGRLSKYILSDINLQLRNILQLNQWNNTTNVLNWFKNIKDKNSYNFLIFDIVEFYPSINEKLLIDSIHFAEQYVNITAENKALIHHARKSLLFCNDQVWIKKSSGLFDVTMGAFDGAEVCELVGVFILFQISQFYNKIDFGLYRDDGLAVFKNASGPKMEKLRNILLKYLNKTTLVFQFNQI